MDSIYRGHAYGKKGKKRIYKMYTKSEADKKGIQYKHWKEAQAGEWAISEDNWVFQCVKRKTYTNKSGSRDYVVYPFKSLFINKSTVLYYEEYRGKIYRFNGASNKTIKELKLRSFIKSDKMPVMVDYYLSTGDKTLAFRFAFPDKKLKEPLLSRLVKKLFKYKEVQTMIHEKIQAQLEKAGLTPESVLEKLNKTWAAAENQSLVEDMLKVIDRYEEYLNMRKEEGVIDDILSPNSLQLMGAAFGETETTLIEGDISHAAKKEEEEHIQQS